MPEIIKTEIKILSFLLMKNTTIIVGKLISGDLYGRDEPIAYFRCVETNGKWKMAALGIRTLKELNESIRHFGLEHVEGSNELEKGFTLVSE
jgi:hypothetical protein